MTAPNIGDLLLAEGFITEADLQRAVQLQRQQPNMRLGALLVSLGLCDQASINDVLDKQLTIRRGELPPLRTTLNLARHAVRVLGNRKQRV